MLVQYPLQLTNRVFESDAKTRGAMQETYSNLKVLPSRSGAQKRTRE